MNDFYKTMNFKEKLFNKEITLLPSVTEVFELELAYLELLMLDKNEIIERSAFVMSYNNEYTKHFLSYSQISEELTKSRSAQTNSYFKNGQFSTGYATHSLFPYRGKFHPQLIKGLINILGIKKGDTILDPMAGSGTTNIEASLMGINSYAIDISPFCQLMIDTKYQALKINTELLKKIKYENDELFDYFNQKNILQKINKISEEKRRIYFLFLLAFLDALGYSKRVVRSNHRQLFVKVLNRYRETIFNLHNNKYFEANDIGDLQVLENSSALDTKLESDSIDCIITSPPYSFAIDYVENDKLQLEYLNCDTENLKSKLIGLKGKTKKNKIEKYFDDMDMFCKEASRILKNNKYLVIIIGSNTNQTGGIRLENEVIKSAQKYNLKLVKSMIKPIKGMRNTMREEYILFFRKEEK
ncbi:MAG: DNA methyltransferase [Candidatus Tenebribacter burtonii]|jgi:tRNA G10  N-methylase Trm11|nr:DNA methyltransferase [Candidatus Tenebribacter burtonii]